MVPGQVGANGVSAARPVEEVGEGEIVSVHLHCLVDSHVMGSHMTLVAAEIMAAVLTALLVSGVPGASVQQLAMRESQAEAGESLKNNFYRGLPVQISMKHRLAA